ncbi:hypothetical protein BC828DRAFT_407939 [Blastocladiella britannica]|nr:hypothetical protein BC828DRAFT_407939 [Blastocladiella britannica]
MSSDRAPVPNHVMAYGEREIYESAKFPPQPHHRTRLIASDAAETHAELRMTPAARAEDLAHKRAAEAQCSQQRIQQEHAAEEARFLPETNCCKLHKKLNGHVVVTQADLERAIDEFSTKHTAAMQDTGHTCLVTDRLNINAKMVRAPVAEFPWIVMGAYRIDVPLTESSEVDVFKLALST